MKLAEDISWEAEKLVRRHQLYAARVDDTARRVRRRGGTPAAKSIFVPRYWAVDAGFNPYKVRGRARSIGYAIERALNSGNYAPRPAVSFEVPKDGGGTRMVSVFQVADNAVSRLVYKQLLTKNSTRFSSRCYAYRTDLTLHDAVLDIASDLRGKKRVFVAEFDFAKYFDSISHDHITALLRDRRFFVTETELRVIRAFLEAPTLSQSNYTRASSQRRERGIPQGTSISLFLANIAAHPLDQQLERLGVGFARFADDTLIWSDDYTAICKAANALDEVSRAMGVEINASKSPGVSILTPSDMSAEFKAKSSIEFLGYEISADRISIRSRSVKRIKDWLSYLVFSNLLREPRSGVCLRSRILPPVDRDYVVMIFQIRRYLYGDLSESQLRRYLARDIPRVSYRGLMSFYPILDDDDLVAQLDGWLLHTVYTALRARSRMFHVAGVPSLPQPHGLAKVDLATFTTRSTKGSYLDLRLPSFSRMSRLLSKASRLFGANAVANPQSFYGSSVSRRAGAYTRLA